ncbi:MAG: hypothetical protein SH868_12920 [Bythopirellula sp.]|nr:hypothetical protein [Bythopirellula sp.]
MNPFDAFKKLQEFNKKPECLHPDSGSGKCSSKIAKAHTVQRGSSLQKIADKGHVYGFAVDAVNLNKSPGRIPVKRIGINDASTFNGFCANHDNTTFSPVEQKPFTATHEQCFLLGYRAMCREFYQKKTVIDAMPFISQLDKGRSLPDQVDFQSSLQSMFVGQTVGLRDLKQRKDAFDKLLVNGNHQDANFYVIETTVTPDVMATFGVTLEFDFEGNRLQNLSDLDKTLESIYITILATESGGAIVLSWLNDTNVACEKFVGSLHRIEDSAVGDAIIRLAFEYSENTFFNPIWWDGLPENIRHGLLDKLTTAISLDVRRLPSCLMPDGKRYVSWPVSGRKSSVEF